MREDGVDIITELLKKVLESKPEDAFCASLLAQYKERGGLSKKQLEGLLGKATKFSDASPGKLATLEAIIKKKNIVDRSAPSIREAVVPDETPLREMNDILQKNPEHKRIVFLKSKWEKKEPLTNVEKDDITRLWKILCKV